MYKCTYELLRIHLKRKMIDDVLFVFIYDDKGDCIQPKKGRNMVRHNLLTFLWGGLSSWPQKGIVLFGNGIKL